jgi:hypothetical protein
MLRFPPSWMPNLTLEPDKLELAVAFYEWTSVWQLFRWVEKDDLVVVGTYLVHYQTVSYWEIILKGGVRGYSLYLHEYVELTWYAEQKHNPFDAAVQIRHHPEAHSLGLLSEHRFLQIVARTMGYDFSLRELILGNPHGDPPQRDWQDVQTHRQQELSLADTALNLSRLPQMQEFYHRLGFKKVT